jgi:molybdate transport system substrate-binding protein
MAALALLAVLLATGVASVAGCGRAASDRAGTTAATPIATAPPSTIGGSLLVFAASDLAPVLDELTPAFATRTGITVTVNAGSTGQLAQQVSAGAPADVFLAADMSSLQRLVGARVLLAGSVRGFARGRLVLVHRPGLTPAPASLADLARVDVGRIALANPQTAPYGKAAKEALTAAGLWSRLGSRLVIAESAAQAQQIVMSGNAGVGLVPLSLAIAGSEPYLTVPQDLYSPLDQGLAIVADSRHEPAALAFIAYLTGPDGRAALEKYGFEVPSTP